MFDVKFSEDNFCLDDYVYLNCAYMGPLSAGTRNAGEHGIFTKLNPVRISSSDFFKHIEEIRDSASVILDASKENFAIVPSVSYGLSILASNIEESAGKNIVLVGDEMPSNVYVWVNLAKRLGLEIRTVKCPDADLDSVGSLWNDAILRAIDESTALVSIGHVHWISGIIFDLFAIREKTKSMGARLIIDGTQSVGALPLSINELKPDAVVVAGYKWLLGPYSLGFMYLDDQFLSGNPLEHHWLNREQSHLFEKLTEYKSEYREGASRFDVGESSNFILAPMLANALKEISNWGVSNVYNHSAKITNDIEISARSMGLKTLPIGQRAGHFLAIEMPSTEHASNIKEALAKEKIITSVRGKAIRVTPHVYNNKLSVERFISGLDRALNSCTTN